MASSRRCVRGFTIGWTISLTISAALLVFFTGYDTTANSFHCALAAPGSATNDWLCWFMWGVAGATLVAMAALVCFMAGILWYRGGVYKFLQLLSLLLPAVAWGVAGGLVIAKGISANQAAGATTSDQAMRISLMVVSCLLCLLLGVAVLLRAVERPGSIQQAELDEVEAERRAEAGISVLRRRYGEEGRRRYGGVEYGLPSSQFLSGMEAGKQHGEGYKPDESFYDDEIYVPRHSMWYGKWLLPAQVDLSMRPYMPPVLDQGKLGTCTVHAAANAFRFALVKEARLSQAYMPSRLFIYYNAKHLLEKEPAVDYYSGSSNRAAFKSVEMYGACQESLFPYEARTLEFKPNQVAYDDAAARKHYLRPIKLLPTARCRDGRWRALVDPQTKAFTLMSALSRGHPVACAIKYHRPTLRALGPRHPVLPFPSREQLRQKDAMGYHAVLLVGYDRKAGWWKLQNSWGTDWALDGYFFAPFELLLHPDFCFDAWFWNN